jgi:hypothetical protein
LAKVVLEIVSDTPSIEVPGLAELSNLFLRMFVDGSQVVVHHLETLGDRLVGQSSFFNGGSTF